MNISHLETAEKRSGSAHRAGGISFLSHLRGEENTLDNFDLLTVYADDVYTAPRHRHNFDQIRIMLEGDFGWAPDKVQKEGTIGYFTQGTMYTQKAFVGSKTLLLQVGGPAGEGYMSYAQMQQGIKEMQEQELGEFKDGSFISKNETGELIKRDSWEAIWEHVFKRKIKYCKPRFEEPPMLIPEHFDWVSTDDAGILAKMFGVFHERGLSLSQYKLEPASQLTLGSGKQTYLLYFLSGKGESDTGNWTTGTAIQVNKGESINLNTIDTTEFYLFGLPVFD